LILGNKRYEFSPPGRIAFVFVSHIAVRFTIDALALEPI